MKIPQGLEGVLSIDPQIMGGEICFTGTRVPLRVLLDNLQEGLSLDEFVEEYPTVDRDQLLAVVRWQQQQTLHAAGLDLAS